MELTSLEFCRLLSWLAYFKHHTLLNKTQMQKILFMCYGMYLSNTSTRLFTDDSAKAWPFGPVFPRVQKRYIPTDTPSNLTIEEREKFSKNKKAVEIAVYIVEKCHKMSAQSLTDWSHKEGSPWYKTLHGELGNNHELKWGKEIDDKLIKEYFKEWEVKKKK